jgi:hypothetical protein
MVVASPFLDEAERIARAVSGPSFRLYPSTDRTGVQLGGALKNVLAIACGIVEGAGLGDSARAALISRGLAELSRFVEAHGGTAETVSGLSGLGDLVLTATSRETFALASRPAAPAAPRCHRANWSRARMPLLSPTVSRLPVASTCRSPMPSPKSSRAGWMSVPPWPG